MKIIATSLVLLSIILRYFDSHNLKFVTGLRIRYKQFFKLHLQKVVSFQIYFISAVKPLSSWGKFLIEK